MIDRASLINPYFYIWFFVCIIQSSITSWTFLRCFKVKVPKPVIYVIIALSANFLSAIIRMTTQSFSAWATAIIIFVQVFGCILVTYGSRFKIAVFFIICLFLDAICELIVHFCLRGMLTNLDEFNVGRVIAAVMFIFPAGVIKYIFSAIWNRIVNKDSDSHLNWVLIFFPSAQMLACVTMMFGFVYDRNVSLLLLILTAMIIFVVSDIIFLIFITESEKKKLIEQELHELEYTRLIEEKHYESIEAKRYEIAKIRHDIKNQIITMRHLISSGQLSDAEELLDGLEKNLDDTAE